MDEKVKVNFGPDAGPLFRQFNGMVGMVTGTKGASGQTELVNLEKIGTGLFLTRAQMEPLPA